MFESVCSSLDSFPTPAAAQAKQGQNDPDGRRGQTLIGSARGQTWGTPTAMEHQGLYLDQKNKGRLRGQVAMPGPALNFPTPQARDYRTGGADRWKHPERTENLNDCVLCFPGLGPLGVELSNTPGNNLGSLNPAWVEQIMGWPAGMSNFTCSEMEWFAWLRQWRLWLFGKD